LSVVQSSGFEPVINAGTARMPDLAVPGSLLALADEVIEWTGTSSFDTRLSTKAAT